MAHETMENMLAWAIMMFIMHEWYVGSLNYSRFAYWVIEIFLSQYQFLLFGVESAMIAVNWVVPIATAIIG